MNLMELWDESQKKCEKLNYHFSKKNFKVPPEARRTICDMTQLKGVSRVEIRPIKDNCSVSFRVVKDKNKARELVGQLCAMIEAWRLHNNIVVSAVPKRIVYKKSSHER